MQARYVVYSIAVGLAIVDHSCSLTSTVVAYVSGGLRSLSLIV